MTGDQSSTAIVTSGDNEPAAPLCAGPSEGAPVMPDTKEAVMDDLTVLLDYVEGKGYRPERVRPAIARLREAVQSDVLRLTRCPNPEGKTAKERWVIRDA